MHEKVGEEKEEEDGKARRERGLRAATTAALSGEMEKTRGRKS